MNRGMLVRVATVTLQQRGVPAAEVHAEAIAAALDMFALVMGDAPPPAAALQPEVRPAPPAFPPLSPAAVAPVEEFAVEPQPSLITTDLRMPTTDDIAGDPRARQAEPLRTLRQPPAGGKMKVEDLNQLIQERTPKIFTADIPMEDGAVSRVLFERNVISQHAHESVQLIYYPSIARTQSAREATEVTAVIHLDDLPNVDLTRIVAKMKADAVEAVRPKGAPREVSVRANLGPVQHADDTYEDPQGITKQSRAVFGSIG